LISQLERSLAAGAGAMRRILLLFGLHLEATLKHCGEFTFLNYVSTVESNSIVRGFICVFKLLESNKDVLRVMYTSVISLLLLQPKNSASPTRNHINNVIYYCNGGMEEIA